MFRKELSDALLLRPMPVAEIAKKFRRPIKEIESDLRHLAKSLRHSDFQLTVTPATCRKCGFEFGPEKLTKPGKCPQCQATWIQEPQVQVTRNEKQG